jgi:hypothetical protein
MKLEILGRTNSQLFLYYMTDIIENNTFCNFFYRHFYLQTVQMQVHLANGVMGGEAGGGAKPGVEVGNGITYKLTN